MATKRNPGKYDCYENAKPDEPMFVLLGRDPVAPFLVDLWREIRSELKCTEQEKLDEAEACAIMMRVWARGLGKSDKLDAVADVLRRRMVQKSEPRPKPAPKHEPGADFK